MSTTTDKMTLTRVEVSCFASLIRVQVTSPAPMGDDPPGGSWRQLWVAIRGPRPDTGAMPSFQTEFLQDGAQTAQAVAGELEALIAAAARTIDVAIYDFQA